jgi:hypothetical protein
MKILSIGKPNDRKKLLLFKYDGAFLHVTQTVNSEKMGKFCLGIFVCSALVACITTVMYFLYDSPYAGAASFIMFCYSSVFAWLSYENIKNGLREEIDLNGL